MHPVPPQIVRPKVQPGEPPFRSSRRGDGGEAGGDKAQVQVIRRAAAVLNALVGNDDGLSLGVIAKRLDLPRSTVQRIVAALEEENFVMAASPAGRVRLGPGLRRLASSVEANPAVVVKPVIVELWRDISETVELSVLKRDYAIFIDQLVGAQRLRTVSEISEHVPLHCTAAGKALLARMEDTDIEARIGRTYPAYTKSTLTTYAALVKSINDARRTGLAYDIEEHDVGVCGVGIAVEDMVGNALAVSVSIPSPRFERVKSLVAEGLLQAKAKLEAAFDHR
jgi:DNA-binding IclR family transcriptional regulator